MNTQLKELIDNKHFSCETFFVGEPPSIYKGAWWDNYNGNFNEEGQTFWNNFPFTFALVDSYGGEGQGDQYWSVYKFTHKDTNEEILIKFDGYYQSYNGAEYMGWSEVKPVEVTKTEYQRA